MFPGVQDTRKYRTVQENQSFSCPPACVLTAHHQPLFFTTAFTSAVGTQMSSCKRLGSTVRAKEVIDLSPLAGRGRWSLGAVIRASTFCTETWNSTLRSGLLCLWKAASGREAARPDLPSSRFRRAVCK